LNDLILLFCIVAFRLLDPVVDYEFLTSGAITLDDEKLIQSFEAFFRLTLNPFLLVSFLDSIAFLLRVAYARSFCFFIIWLEDQEGIRAPHFRFSE